uniref:Sulfotransferase n=1 Tax=Bos taurus TaxID=9913 RepID=A0A3Q1N4J6_BOVIN
MDNTDTYLLNFKGCDVHHSTVDFNLLEHLDDFEIGDDDVFIIVYPKSGTIWSQTEIVETVDSIPFLEYKLRTINHDKRPSPLIFSSHNPYYLAPKDLNNKKAKVYFSHLQKPQGCFDLFHFPNSVATLEGPDNMGDFMEQFLDVKVLGRLWSDHIRGWYEHRHDFNILFLMYEEMKMVRGVRSVTKISNFPEKELNEEDVDDDPRANYNNILTSEVGTRTSQGRFLCKGTIGDWKCHLTVEQNEKFDRAFQRKMKDFPSKFIWDINEE